MNYDFSANNELFQPEEIFQLDQPLRTADYCQQETGTSKSPPTLLDLGSGTIHRSCLKAENEGFWMLPPVESTGSTATLDDSNSNSSRIPQCSPEITDNTLRNNFRMDDSCRMNFQQEVLQRMNINLVEFHLDECKESEFNTKYQIEDHQTRQYNLQPLEDNNRYHHQTIETGLETNIICGSNLSHQLHLTNLSQCVESQYLHYNNHLDYQRNNEIKHENQYLISDSSQDESTTSLGEFNLRPQTSSMQTENNFFHSFQYQNQNHFQHIPHH